MRKGLLGRMSWLANHTDVLVAVVTGVFLIMSIVIQHLLDVWVH